MVVEAGQTDWASGWAMAKERLQPDGLTVDQY
jgi:hypothetical protein